MLSVNIGRLLRVPPIRSGAAGEFPRGTDSDQAALLAPNRPAPVGVSEDLFSYRQNGLASTRSS